MYFDLARSFATGKSQVRMKSWSPTAGLQSLSMIMFFLKVGQGRLSAGNFCTSAMSTPCCDCPPAFSTLKASKPMFSSLTASRHLKRRWRSFTYDELMARDKVNLDIFWLRDESLEDSANLPNPDVLASEIVEDLKAALSQFESIEEDLANGQA